MNIRRWLVLLGLLNCAFLAIICWQAKALRAANGKVQNGFEPASQRAGNREDSKRLPNSPDASSLLKSSAASSASSRPAFDWNQVESDDYRTFMTNLRAIGCPEQTLRDIITADVVGAYASKRNELMAARYRDFKYWEAPREPGPEFAQQRRAVDDETASALRQLLGEETLMPATANEWKAAELEQQLSFLSSDKLESTRSLLMRNQETDELAKTLSDGHRPTEDAEELQRILRAYEEKRASLSRLLTPEEYAKVEFAVSWTADNLRQAMKNFHPSEQEFQNIFRVWRAHDEDLVRRYATGEPDPGNDHVFARIREYLGEQRFEQYRRTWWQ